MSPVGPRWRRLGAALTLFAFVGPFAFAQAPTPVRSGDHPGFGRVVIDTTGATTYHVDQDGDHVLVRFEPKLTLGKAPRPPRNVAAISTADSLVELTLAAGKRLRDMRLDGRVVLDVFDTSDNKTAQPATKRPDPKPVRPLAMALSPELGGRTATGAIIVTAPLKPATETARPDQQVAAAGRVDVQSTPLPLPPADDDRASGVVTPMSPGRDVLPEVEGPAGLMARRVRPPKGMDGSAFLIPFNANTGAAAFRTHSGTYVVFDERRPIDLSALQGDEVFGSATIQLLPAGTLLRLPLPAALSIALSQTPLGWKISALKVMPKLEPIVLTQAAGRLDLAADKAGDVVAMTDPDSGAILLVGTQRRPGQGLPFMRQSTEFVLRPTLQGIVVDPLADAITLKPIPTGFTIAGRPDGLLLSPSTSQTNSMIDAARLTRRLAFTSAQPAELLRRLIDEVDDAAIAPALARGAKHRVVAQTMIELGLSAEAESLLHLSAEEDPREAASPETIALTAIAALLAGRTAEAAGIDDPSLTGTDEIALWRAVRQAMLDEGSPAAAATFSTTASLALFYPPAMRDRLLPLVLETMIKGGETTRAAHLLALRKNDPKLGFARALLAEAEGDTERAIASYDSLANGHDQYDRARASVREVELKLASRRIEPAAAADTLDKLLDAWRGDERELAQRERVADLRGQTGAWRVALATLRQAEIDFPDQAASIRGHLKDSFARMIGDSGATRMQPIDFVAMIDENTDLMPAAGDGASIETALADRLITLDLPERAKPVLDKLMRTATNETAKARFGVGLATLEAHDGEDPAAIAALDASDAGSLPADLVEQRLLVRASVVAHAGDAAAAASMLTALPSGATTAARAQILETANDWRGAAKAWLDCAALTVPASGMLNEAQTRTILRLATATARANDEEALATLRVKYDGRIESGPLGDMFRLLVAEPVRSSQDINRLQQELRLAASLPTSLNALQPAAATR